MTKTFGEKIREKRIELKLTLEEVAIKIDSAKTYVWELENKATARPSADKLLKLADALGLSPDYLLDDAKEKETEEDSFKAFYRRFAKMSKSDQETLLRLANAFPTKTDKK